MSTEQNTNEAQGGGSGLNVESDDNKKTYLDVVRIEGDIARREKILFRKKEILNELVKIHEEKKTLEATVKMLDMRLNALIKEAKQLPKYDDA